MSVTSELARIGVPAVKHNTTNAWGFAGAVYKEYLLPDGARVAFGKNYYRHARPTSFLYLQETSGQQLTSRTSIELRLATYATAPKPEPKPQAARLNPTAGKPDGTQLRLF
jgi:hypothetical protein